VLDDGNSRINSLRHSPLDLGLCLISFHLYITSTNHLIAFSCHSDLGCIANLLYSYAVQVLRLVLRTPFAKWNHRGAICTYSLTSELAASFRLIIYWRETLLASILTRGACGLVVAFYDEHMINIKLADEFFARRLFCKELLSFLKEWASFSNTLIILCGVSTLYFLGLHFYTEMLICEFYRLNNGEIRITLTATGTANLSDCSKGT